MEAFSEQSRRASSDVRDIKSLAVMTPARFQLLFDQRLNDICASFEEWNIPLTVIGRLGTLPEDTWRRHEALPLIDQQGGVEIRLEMPYSSLEEVGLRSGDFVRATGVMRARLVRGQVVARLDVLNLSAHEHGMRLGSHMVTTSLSSLLRGLPLNRHDFPSQVDAQLLILGVGISTQKMEKISHQLGGLWRKEAVRCVSLSLNDTPQCAQHLYHASEDIILVVVAEGCETMIEDENILKAFASSQAHRIFALGYELDNSAALSEKKYGFIAQHLVDQSFDSSVEAMRYIRQKSGQYRKSEQEEQARQEELSALRSSLAKLTDVPQDIKSHSLSVKFLLIGVVIGSVIMGFLGILFFQIWA